MGSSSPPKSGVSAIFGAPPHRGMSCFEFYSRPVPRFNLKTRLVELAKNKSSNSANDNVLTQFGYIFFNVVTHCLVRVFDEWLF